MNLLNNFVKIHNLSKFYFLRFFLRRVYVYDAYNSVVVRSVNVGGGVLNRGVSRNLKELVLIFLRFDYLMELCAFSAIELQLIVSFMDISMFQLRIFSDWA